MTYGMMVVKKMLKTFIQPTTTTAATETASTIAHISQFFFVYIECKLTVNLHFYVRVPFTQTFFSLVFSFFFHFILFLHAFYCCGVNAEHTTVKLNQAYNFFIVSRSLILFFTLPLPLSHSPLVFFSLQIHIFVFDV